MPDTAGSTLAKESEVARGGDAARLDGNAAAGILSELFVPDLTTARTTCAHCGTIRMLGALLVYAHPMGMVMRCPTCDGVVLRMARMRSQLWLDLTGAKLLVMAAQTATAPPVT
jgi:hypothetical protein